MVIEGLKEARESREMTAEELAAAAGVSLRTVWNAEQGKPVNCNNGKRIKKAAGIK